jgi:hypothetical protein
VTVSFGEWSRNLKHLKLVGVAEVDFESSHAGELVLDSLEIHSRRDFYTGTACIRAKTMVALQPSILRVFGVEKLVLLQPTKLKTIVQSLPQVELLKELVIADATYIHTGQEDLRGTAIDSLTLPRAKYASQRRRWEDLVPTRCRVTYEAAHKLKATYAHLDHMKWFSSNDIEGDSSEGDSSSEESDDSEDMEDD